MRTKEQRLLRSVMHAAGETLAICAVFALLYCVVIAFHMHAIRIEAVVQ